MQDLVAIVIQLDFLLTLSLTWESHQFQTIFHFNGFKHWISWWSHDIGGHMLGYSDEELQTRWLQYGILNQLHDFIVRKVHLIVRSHGSLRSILRKS